MFDIHPSRLISGAFLGIDHFSEEEGARFQAEIRALTEDQWAAMIDDMHGIGIDTLIFQQCATRREGGERPTAYYAGPSRPRMRGEPFRGICRVSGAIADRGAGLFGAAVR